MGRKEGRRVIQMFSYTVQTYLFLSSFNLLSESAILRLMTDRSRLRSLRFSVPSKLVPILSM